ncbi:MAG: Arsenite oxidase subunit AioB [Fimbriimonadaceae bacterium]|nr:Arsenite oxidase subunit AioB [Fimbriimonadaceae bacterium]
MDEHLRQDFPIDWEDDGYVSRREFFKFMTVASGGLALGSIGLAAWSRTLRDHRTFEPKLVGTLQSIAPGSALPFTYPRDTDICLLIRRPDGEIAAFSRRCTHLSCPVDYQPLKGRLYCPCHNGAFSAEDGSVIQGPPPHPLPQIMIENRDGELWAVGVRS